MTRTAVEWETPKRAHVFCHLSTALPCCFTRAAALRLIFLWVWGGVALPPSAVCRMQLHLPFLPDASFCAVQPEDRRYDQ